MQISTSGRICLFDKMVHFQRVEMAEFSRFHAGDMEVAEEYLSTNDEY